MNVIQDYMWYRIQKRKDLHDKGYEGRRDIGKKIVIVNSEFLKHYLNAKQGSSVFMTSRVVC